MSRLLRLALLTKLTAPGCGGTIDRPLGIADPLQIRAFAVTAAR